MTPGKSLQDLQQEVEALANDVKRLDRTLNSADPEKPGVALRVDRLERQMSMSFKLFISIAGFATIWQFGTILANVLARQPA